MAAATRGKRREAGRAQLASAQLHPAGPSSLQVRGEGEAREEGIMGGCFALLLFDISVSVKIPVHQLVP